VSSRISIRELESGQFRLSILLSCARTISDVAEEEEEEQQQDPSSAKSMTDSSRQAGRKKKFLRNCAKVRAEESQARMFFTAGRKKSEDFFQGRAQISLVQQLSIFVSLSLSLNLLTESIIEKVFALAMCMQLTGVMSINRDVHFREMIVGCRALFKWFHLQWDHPRCGGSPSCRLENAHHALFWQLLLMILSSSSLAFFHLGTLYIRSQPQCSTQIQHSYWCKS